MDLEYKDKHFDRKHKSMNKEIMRLFYSVILEYVKILLITFETFYDYFVLECSNTSVPVSFSIFVTN